MKRRTQRAQFEVQPLEGRALLSTLGHGPRHGVVELARAANPTILSGRVTGRLVIGTGQLTVTLRQGSTIQKAGAIKGGGTLLLNEEGAIGGGTLTVGNKKGQLVLNVTGGETRTTGPKPQQILYLTVASGSGVFSNLSGGAIATLTLQPKKPPTVNFTGTVRTAI